jgi:drug/metabolite transporter (DMT)-like permease
MILAALFLPLLNAAVKYLSGRYPVLELLWARYAGHLAFMLVVSAAASAVTQVLSRKVAGHDAPETSNTYMVLAGFILASLPLAFVWHTPASGPDALVLCSLGIFGGLGHYCLVRAFELAPAPFVSPFNYAQILGAAVLSSAVFGQAPDLWTWIGSAIIVFSGVFILLNERLRVLARRNRPG